MIYQMSGIPDMKYGRVSFRKLGGGGRRFFIWFGLAKDHNNIMNIADFFFGTLPYTLKLNRDSLYV